MRNWELRGGGAARNWELGGQGAPRNWEAQEIGSWGGGGAARNWEGGKELLGGGSPRELGGGSPRELGAGRGGALRSLELGRELQGMGSWEGGRSPRELGAEEGGEPQEIGSFVGRGSPKDLGALGAGSRKELGTGKGERSPRDLGAARNWGLGGIWRWGGGEAPGKWELGEAGFGFPAKPSPGQGLPVPTWARIWGWAPRGGDGGGWRGNWGIGISRGDPLPPASLAADVTLDPDTAHPRLSLSLDRRSVKLGERRQDLPDNPKRFDADYCVLGAQGFSAGRHYWEVEVGGRRGWAVGAARETARRKEKATGPPQKREIWCVGTNGKKYQALTATEQTALAPGERPRRFGVYLDYERGQLCFYNAESMSHIHTFNASFRERIFPFFRVLAKGTRIKICA